MPHFTRATFRFLRELAAHNDKGWFHARKQEYERHVRAPALDLVPAWLEHLPTRYVGRATKSSGAVCPPHHDLRFRRDKTPYRTHVAVRLRHRLALPGAPGPAFLLWVAPDRSFVSAGVRNASGEARRRIVAAILEDPQRWEDVRRGLAMPEEDLLQKTPPGAPPEVGQDLRRRHFTAEVCVSQRMLTSSGLVGYLADVSTQLLPLNEFLADALYS